MYLSRHLDETESDIENCLTSVNLRVTEMDILPRCLWFEGLHYTRLGRREDWYGKEYKIGGHEVSVRTWVGVGGNTSEGIGSHLMLYPYPEMSNVSRSICVGELEVR